MLLCFKVLGPRDKYRFRKRLCNRTVCYLCNRFFLISGNVDIVNGNLKLILGLIWSLIVRYQIGRSKFPPKKLMLAWLKVRITTKTFSVLEIYVIQVLALPVVSHIKYYENIKKRSNFKVSYSCATKFY